jgi:hypothetical protein
MEALLDEAEGFLDDPDDDDKRKKLAERLNLDVKVIPSEWSKFGLRIVACAPLRHYDYEVTVPIETDYEQVFPMVSKSP